MHKKYYFIYDEEFGHRFYQITSDENSFNLMPLKDEDVSKAFDELETHKIRHVKYDKVTNEGKITKNDALYIYLNDDITLIINNAIKFFRKPNAKYDSRIDDLLVNLDSKVGELEYKILNGTSKRENERKKINREILKNYPSKLYIPLESLDKTLVGLLMTLANDTEINTETMTEKDIQVNKDYNSQVFQSYDNIPTVFRSELAELTHTAEENARNNVKEMPEIERVSRSEINSPYDIPLEEEKPLDVFDKTYVFPHIPSEARGLTSDVPVDIKELAKEFEEEVRRSGR